MAAGTWRHWVGANAWGDAGDSLQANCICDQECRGKKVEAQMKSLRSQFMSSFLALVGPSDVGGTCPTKSYVYTWERTEYCCCGGNCCWVRCTWTEPPASCLPPGAAWHYNTKKGFYSVSATTETTTSVFFAPEGYVLKWEDDFNGVGINTTNWVIARSAAK